MFWHADPAHVSILISVEVLQQRQADLFLRSELELRSLHDVSQLCGLLLHCIVGMCLLHSFVYLYTFLLSPAGLQKHCNQGLLATNRVRRRCWTSYWRSHIGPRSAIACAVFGSSSRPTASQSSVRLTSNPIPSPGMPQFGVHILFQRHILLCDAVCLVLLPGLKRAACAHCTSNTYLVCQRLPKLDFTAQFAEGALLVKRYLKQTG